MYQQCVNVYRFSHVYSNKHKTFNKHKSPQDEKIKESKAKKVIVYKSYMFVIYLNFPMYIIYIGTNNKIILAFKLIMTTKKFL